MRNQQQIRTNAGWNARMGEPNGAIKEWPGAAGGTAALRALWPRTPSQLHPQQTAGTVATLLVQRRSRSTDGSQLHHLRGQGESISQSPSKSSKPCVPLACRRHLTHSIVARTRPMRSAARLSSPFRRRAMRPAVSNGSIRRRNQRTDLSQGNLRSVGTTALAHVAELERRLQEASYSAPQLTAEQRAQLLALGDDLDRAWDNPHAPITLKKRILRTVLQEIIADTT